MTKVAQGFMVMGLRLRGRTRDAAVDQVAELFAMHQRLVTTNDVTAGTRTDTTPVDGPPELEQLRPDVLDAWSRGKVWDSIQLLRNHAGRVPTVQGGPRPRWVKVAIIAGVIAMLFALACAGFFAFLVYIAVTGAHAAG
ncbi:MAG: hypothetical protein ABIO38_07190 [Luteimonas sp.]